MKYWYCYIPALIALLPLLFSTIVDCIADSAKKRAARKNQPKQRPEIISADATRAPPAHPRRPPPCIISADGHVAAIVQRPAARTAEIIFDCAYNVGIRPPPPTFKKNEKKLKKPLGTSG